MMVRGIFQNCQRRLMQQQIKMASISCLRYIRYLMIGIMMETLISFQTNSQSAYASQGIVMYANDGTGKRFNTSVVDHLGFNKDDTGPATMRDWPEGENSKWNAGFGLRMIAQDYNQGWSYGLLN